MSGLNEKIEKDLETIALEVVTLDEEDIPAMGSVLNCLCSLEEDYRKAECPQFLELTLALTSYLEKVTLRETSGLEPVEAGIGYLQSAFRASQREEEFELEISPILEKLGCVPSRATGNEPEQ